MPVDLGGTALKGISLYGSGLNKADLCGAEMDSCTGCSWRQSSGSVSTRPTAGPPGVSLAQVLRPLPADGIKSGSPQIIRSHRNMELYVRVE